jgi:hypothetical protein
MTFSAVLAARLWALPVRAMSARPARGRRERSIDGRPPRNRDADDERAGWGTLSHGAHRGAENSIAGGAGGMRASSSNASAPRHGIV